MTNKFLLHLFLYPFFLIIFFSFFIFSFVTLVKSHIELMQTNMKNVQRFVHISYTRVLRVYVNIDGVTLLFVTLVKTPKVKLMQKNMYNVQRFVHISYTRVLHAIVYVQQVSMGGKIFLLCLIFDLIFPPMETGSQSSFAYSEK